MNTHHPVNDFLTPDTIEFLQSLGAKKIKYPHTIFYGPGANGKSTFLRILQKIVSCMSVTPNMINRRYGGIPHEIQIIERTKPDLIVIQEPENDELIHILKNIERIKVMDINVPVVVMCNSLPENLVDETGKSTIKNIQVIHFKNEYLVRGGTEPYYGIGPCYGCDHVTAKQSIHPEMIEDDQGVQIIKNIMRIE